MNRTHQGSAVLTAFLVMALALSGVPCSAANEPYEVHAVLSITGPISFVGTEESRSLDAFTMVVNRSGGIAGHPVKFVVHDDQSNPQLAVQLVNQLIDMHVPAMIGPGYSATCNVAVPLVEKAGPVEYCLSASLHPAAGSFIFGASAGTDDDLIVTIRYLRMRGLTKLGLLTSTDATGQDADRTINAALSAPENSGMSVVDHEHFGTSDLNVTAQVTRVKAFHPQAIIAWTTGSAFGTALRGIQDVGLDVPVITTPANQTPIQMTQYAQFLPKELIFPTVRAISPNAGESGRVKALQDTYFAALKSAGVQPDFNTNCVWDPALFLVSALRKNPTSTAAAVRDYLLHEPNLIGINGKYEFSSGNQRGLGQDSVVVSRWNPKKSEFEIISKPGGNPFPRVSKL
jgi:branched-chain amino acid transport system substrate-binding protein